MPHNEVELALTTLSTTLARISDHPDASHAEVARIYQKETMRFLGVAMGTPVPELPIRHGNVREVLRLARDAQLAYGDPALALRHAYDALNLLGDDPIFGGGPLPPPPR